MGSLSLLRGIFPTQESNWGLLHCRWILYQLSSQGSLIMLKILHVRLQQYMNCEIPGVQAGFKKGRGTEIKLPTSIESSKKNKKKQENSRKISTSALLILPKPLTVWIRTDCGKFFKRWEYQTTLPTS